MFVAIRIGFEDLHCSDSTGDRRTAPGSNSHTIDLSTKFELFNLWNILIVMRRE